MPYGPSLYGTFWGHCFANTGGGGGQICFHMLFVFMCFILGGCSTLLCPEESYGSWSVRLAAHGVGLQQRSSPSSYAVPSPTATCWLSLLSQLSVFILCRGIAVASACMNSGRLEALAILDREAVPVAAARLLT